MKRFKVLLVLAVLLAMVFLAGCNNPSGGSGGNSRATLVIENMTTYDGEYITLLRWTNKDTGTSQIERFSGGIAVRESRSLSLAEGTYDIEIETNYDDYDSVYDIRLYGGRTVTLIWNGSYLSTRR
jgi:hypothetical protein